VREQTRQTTKADKAAARVSLPIVNNVKEQKTTGIQTPKKQPRKKQTPTKKQPTNVPREAGLYANKNKTVKQ